MWVKVQREFIFVIITKDNNVLDELERTDLLQSKELTVYLVGSFRFNVVIR